MRRRAGSTHGPQRSALSNELFAYWQATSPEKHHCFCGSDQDLIDAVAEIRAERERADDDEEIGS